MQSQVDVLQFDVGVMQFDREASQSPISPSPSDREALQFDWSGNLAK